MSNTIGILVEYENRLGAVEVKQASTDVKLLELESKVTNRPDYFSIMGYAALKKLTLGFEKAKALGLAAKKLCVELGFDVEKVADPRFGQVNTYPSSVLKVVFGLNA